MHAHAIQYCQRCAVGVGPHHTLHVVSAVESRQLCLHAAPIMALSSLVNRVKRNNIVTHERGTYAKCQRVRRPITEGITTRSRLLLSNKAN